MYLAQHQGRLLSHHLQVLHNDSDSQALRLPVKLARMRTQTMSAS